MAEKIQTQANSLFATARLLGVDEIVVPDVLADGVATVEHARDFKFWASIEPQYKYMGVVQGRTVNEAMACVWAFEKLGYINTIGIPRLLANYCGRGARADLASYIQEEFGYKRFDIHYLGCSRYVDEVQYLAQVGGRGIDTSMPFALGMAGIDILERKYIDRPTLYFNLTGFKPVQLELMQHNVDVFRTWAGAFANSEEASSSEV